MSDWGGVYLRQGLGAPAQLAAFAFAFYSLGLVVGRGAGDHLTDRLGSRRLMQVGTITAALAMITSLVVGSPPVALVCLTITGIGLGNNYPQMYGAAGRIPPVGPSLSAVFAFSTLAFMVEPAIMGIVTDALGIRVAMWMPVAAALPHRHRGQSCARRGDQRALQRPCRHGAAHLMATAGPTDRPARASVARP